MYDNRDRYGKRHRQESEYDVGEPEPGTVGDSRGTSGRTRIIDEKEEVGMEEFLK